jgi:hypothetical protein
MMRSVRYALLALAIFAVLAAGPVYEWRGSKGTDVPAIELRPERPRGEKAAKLPTVRKERRSERRSDSTEGATPAPAPAPAPAGGDDDDDDDGEDDDGDDDGDDGGDD